jgi:hypothetical protein
MYVGGRAKESGVVADVVENVLKKAYIANINEGMFLE